jgi:hypothetical protein
VSGSSPPRPFRLAFHGPGYIGCLEFIFMQINYHPCHYRPIGNSIFDTVKELRISRADARVACWFY